MKRRVPPVGWTGLDSPHARLPARPIGSSHKLMRSVAGGVRTVAPNGDKGIRRVMGAAQILMTADYLKKARRGFGPATSGI